MIADDDVHVHVLTTGLNVFLPGIGMVQPKSPNLLSPQDRSRDDVELPGSGRVSPSPPVRVISISFHIRG